VVIAVPRLKRRSEFLRVAKEGRRWVTPGLILQMRRRDAGEWLADREPGIRVGFTASRKVGKAVVRNRARRRLRAVAEQVLPRHAGGGCDFVIIARVETVNRPFGALLEDLTTALRRLKVYRTAADKTPASGGPFGRSE
jgi:ribonuclease P protein component